MWIFGGVTRDVYEARVREGSHTEARCSWTIASRVGRGRGRESAHSTRFVLFPFGGPSSSIGRSPSRICTTTCSRSRCSHSTPRSCQAGLPARRDSSQLWSLPSFDHSPSFDPPLRCYHFHRMLPIQSTDLKLAHRGDYWCNHQRGHTSLDLHPHRHSFQRKLLSTVRRHS